jgi:hypothetical protein
MALQAYFEFCKKFFTNAKELLSMKKNSWLLCELLPSWRTGGSNCFLMKESFNLFVWI